MIARSMNTRARRTSLTAAVLCGILLVLGLATAAAAEPTLLEMFEIIKNKEFVDLTHTFDPNIPHWPGFPEERRETIYWYDKGVGSMGHGFFAQVFCHVGQWGTHVDAPAHFIQGKRTLDQIDVREMFLELVVIDVHEKVEKDRDYMLTVEDIKDWEKKYGPVPEGSFVAMRTDWSKRWPEKSAMQEADEDGVIHYPGWGIDAMKYLFEERKITACGHEPTDTDPGVRTSKGDYTCETYVLAQDKYQVELMANLDKVPEHGALVVVAFPKPYFGSGFPARVFAILP